MLTFATNLIYKTVLNPYLLKLQLLFTSGYLVCVHILFRQLMVSLSLLVAAVLWLVATQRLMNVTPVLFGSLWGVMIDYHIELIFLLLLESKLP